MSFDGHNGLSTIQFTAVIGSDGVIHPPSGVELPNGKVEVSVRVTPLAELGDRSTESADRRPRPAQDYLRASSLTWPPILMLLWRI